MSKINRRVLLGPLVGAMLLLGPALGGASGVEMRVAQRDMVCAVLDDTIATQALGSAAIRDRNSQSAQPGMCNWRSSGVAGDGLTVALDGGGHDKYEFDHHRMPVQKLQGIGDEAFAFVSPAGFVQMGMMKDGQYVTILLQLQNDPGRLGKAEALARTIAARL